MCFTHIIHRCEIESFKGCVTKDKILKILNGRQIGSLQVSSPIEKAGGIHTINTGNFCEFFQSH